ncbi:MAG: serine/threonine protein kinase [Gammaproteobacteria bacterium]|nr:serine/threonine protein kinase [Gammaproteobacteria bacterium]
MSNARSVVDVNGVRYELAHLLGRGGQGAVYAVKGGRLAVKLLAGRGPSRRERIRNQLTMIRRLPLRDLALAKPLEMLRPPHTGYVMELLTGMVPIKSLLAPPRGQAPTVEWYQHSGGIRRRLRVLARAAHVLAQLHGRGLAYSDPSPANIFVSDDDAFAEVRFIDADNLRYESAPGSSAGVYTPGYGAPELVRGESGITTLTDVHAFSVIAFQVLTLAHPFIGDLVNDGEPELEENALAGQLPWIDDPADRRNRASFGVPRDRVLSKRLREGFGRAFGEGRVSPAARPGAAEWADRFFAAADATIECSSCGGSFYFNHSRCTWCDADRPTFAVALFNLWDPGHGPNGGFLSEPHRGGVRSTLVGHGAITARRPYHITRRLAFGRMETNAEDPVIEVRLSDGQIRLRSVDGAQYRLVLPSGARETVVFDREQVMRMTAGLASSRLHFGSRDSLHRVVSFELHPGGTA